MTVVAAVALFAATSENEVELTPTEIANIEALTKGKGMLNMIKTARMGAKKYVCLIRFRLFTTKLYIHRQMATV